MTALAYVVPIDRATCTYPHCHDDATVRIIRQGLSMGVYCMAHGAVTVASLNKGNE